MMERSRNFKNLGTGCSKTDLLTTNFPGIHVIDIFHGLTDDKQTHNFKKKDTIVSSS